MKNAVKNKTGTTLRMNLKMFDGNNLPHELLLTTRQKKKLRKAFNNNISTGDILYFDSFGVEHVPEEIKKFVGNKNIKANIIRVQANNSVMCSYFCIGFIDFMLAGKKLTDFTNLFSPHDFNKNDSIILSYFKNIRNW